MGLHKELSTLKGGQGEHSLLRGRRDDVPKHRVLVGSHDHIFFQTPQFGLWCSLEKLLYCTGLWER